jgi:hypothetical protein
MTFWAKPKLGLWRFNAPAPSTVRRPARVALRVKKTLTTFASNDDFRKTQKSIAKNHAGERKDSAFVGPNARSHDFRPPTFAAV